MLARFALALALLPVIMFVLLRLALTLATLLLAGLGFVPIIVLRTVRHR